ncbi:hypothetical protein FKB34_16550 [Glycocaulis profundi]|nr:hypothetical protein FKB34_16550 [Glycocaulis profundi]
MPEVVLASPELPGPREKLVPSVNLVPMERMEVLDLMVFKALRVILGGWGLRVHLVNREMTDPVVTLVRKDLKETLVLPVRPVSWAREEKLALRDLVESLVFQVPKVQLVVMVPVVHPDP